MFELIIVIVVFCLAVDWVKARREKQLQKWVDWKRNGCKGPQPKT